jgi:pyruvate/2-oxoglutarate/acetoin dehydrogenase E1 component
MNIQKEISYKDTLINAMTELSKLNETIFIGQQIVYAGNPMSTTLMEVPKEKMIEVPVMEETQMGISLGLAMVGKMVISFYPRWDFLISAANQLINHVDKFELMTGKKLNILIRVGKGADTPLDPGHQHKANYVEQFKTMCPNIEIHDLKTWQDVELSYNYVIKEGGIHILAEYPELYNK